MMRFLAVIDFNSKGENSMGACDGVSVFIMDSESFECLLGVAAGQQHNGLLSD